MSARVLVLLTAALTAAPVTAQVGLGVVLGDPTGFTAEAGAGPASVAVDVGITGDLFGQAHVLLRNSAFRGELSDLRVLVGPGGFVHDAEAGRRAGVSALLGLAAALPARLEAFGQVTPGLRLTPDVAPRVGAAVGLRYVP